MGNPEIDAAFFSMMQPMGLDFAARDNRAPEIRDRYLLSGGRLNSEDCKRIADLFADYGHIEVSPDAIGEFVIKAIDTPDDIEWHASIERAAADPEVRCILKWLHTTETPEMLRQDYESYLIQLVGQKYEIPLELADKVWEQCRRSIEQEYKGGN